MSEAILKTDDGKYVLNIDEASEKRYDSLQDAHDALIKTLARQSFNLKDIKTSQYHGGIGGGTPTGWSQPGWSPSTGANPQFNPFTVVPEYGGRWRGEGYTGRGDKKPGLPGAGDMQINDNEEKAPKSLKQQRQEDYHEIFLKNLIEDKIHGVDVDKDGNSYIAVVTFKNEKKAKEFAKKHKGKAEAEGRTVNIYCPNFEAALKLERKIPGIVIKTI
jgi:hypothetical protein